MPPDVEHRLSPGLLAKAIRSGNEYGWRFEDLPAVLAESRSIGLAVLGGQVQIALPDGTCELYWRNADPAPRKNAESWDSFVERSHAEMREGLACLPDVGALVREGIERFPFLRQRAEEGADIQSLVCFICYFEGEQ